MSGSKLWLITGATSGLGLELTKAVLATGDRVVACCRDASKNPAVTADVENLGGKWLQLDVAANDVEDRIRAAVATHGKIDVLVNNAGYCIAGSIEQTGIDEARVQFDTTFFGPLRIVQAILPYMRAAKSGTIINVSSGSGISAEPGLGVYGASKQALEGLTEGLALELSSFNIRVMLVVPGLMATNFTSPSAAHQIPFMEEYIGTAAHQFIEGVKDINPSMAGSPVKAALRIVEAVNGTGMLEGREVGLRLPVGTSGWNLMKKGKEYTDLAENMKDVWQSI